MTITVYLRQGCHLCEQALADIARVAGPAHPVREIDIDAEPSLVARYGEEVPVIEVAGREVSHWFVDEKALRKALGEFS